MWAWRRLEIVVGFLLSQIQLLTSAFDYGHALCDAIAKVYIPLSYSLLLDHIPVFISFIHFLLYSSKSLQQYWNICSGTDDTVPLIRKPAYLTIRYYPVFSCFDSPYLGRSRWTSSSVIRSCYLPFSFPLLSTTLVILHFEMSKPHINSMHQRKYRWYFDQQSKHFLPLPQVFFNFSWNWWQTWNKLIIY